MRWFGLSVKGDERAPPRIRPLKGPPLRYRGPSLSGEASHRLETFFLFRLRAVLLHPTSL